MFFRDVTGVPWRSCVPMALALCAVVFWSQLGSVNQAAENVQSQALILTNVIGPILEMVSSNWFSLPAPLPLSLHKARSPDCAGRSPADPVWLPGWW